MQLNIQIAEYQDAAELLLLQRLAYQSEAELHQDWLIPPLTQTLAELEQEFAHKRFLKAAFESVIVGSGRAWQLANTVYIGRLAVLPERQGQGIGSALLTALEQQFPTASRFELFTGQQSLNNLAWYQKQGYHPFKTEVMASGTGLVFMEKWLRTDTATTGY